jgi:chemotaxis methyl-accepting protein methylase
MNVSCYKKEKLTPCYTESFRDPEVWDALRGIIHNLMRNNAENGAHIFRVWSAGCASGEEVVSLASIFQDLQIEIGNPKLIISIYGTDIREDKIDEAIQLLETRQRSGKLNIRLRKHDLVVDDPLLHMNLILCRNVLMFFKPEYQIMICQKLHRSLRSGGYLILGKAESLKGESEKMFTVIDNKNRIFCKK